MIAILPIESDRPVRTQRLRKKEDAIVMIVAVAVAAKTPAIERQRDYRGAAKIPGSIAIWAENEFIHVHVPFASSLKIS